MTSLTDLLKKLNKNIETGSIELGIKFKEVEKIPFKSIRLNYMTYGGLPLGRIAEFSGADGSGKTTTALDILAQAQKKFPDKKALFCDIEGTLDTKWAYKLGVNIEDIIVYRPGEKSAEDVFEALLELINTGEISICILDSLGAMVSAQAYEKTIAEKTYAGISQSLTAFSKKLVPILAKTDCVFIGINQIRDDLNSAYGGTITTGGKAWKHNCTTRIQFRKGNYVDEKGNSLTKSCENPQGNIVNAHLEKSKVCPPDRKISSYTLMYQEGIDYVSDLIEVAIKEGYILAAGAWFTICNEAGEPLEFQDGSIMKFQGKSKVKNYLNENQDLYNKLFTLINNDLSSTGSDIYAK